MRAKSVTFQATETGWPAAWKPCQDAGYQTELWASCSQISPEALRGLLESYRPARFTAQVENGNEAQSLRDFAAKGVFAGHILDVVIIGQDFDASKWEPASLGAQRTWFEAYLEDGRSPQQIEIDILPHWPSYPNPRPLIGCYHGMSPAAYNLTDFGRNYGVYLWEECDQSWFAQMP